MFFNEGTLQKLLSRWSLLLVRNEATANRNKRNGLDTCNSFSNVLNLMDWKWSHILMLLKGVICDIYCSIICTPSLPITYIKETLWTYCNLLNWRQSEQSRHPIQAGHVLQSEITNLLRKSMSSSETSSGRAGLMHLPIL